MYKIPANTLFTGQNLIYVPECHSTNTLLYDLNDSQALTEGTVVVTDNQTSGRGQRGNTWQTDPGLNLTFSLLLKPGFLAAKEQFRLNMTVSVAIVGALRAYISSDLKLKWPNDIYFKDKKLGGVLIENQLQGNFLSSSVVGIGLNINQQNFSTATASSIYNVTGKANNLNEVFQKILSVLEGEYIALKTNSAPDLKERYIKSLYKYRERQVFEAEDERFEGLIYDVDESGRICIEDGIHNRIFAFKEVKFIGS